MKIACYSFWIRGQKLKLFSQKKQTEGILCTTTKPWLLLLKGAFPLWHSALTERDC